MNAGQLNTHHSYLLPQNHSTVVKAPNPKLNCKSPKFKLVFKSPQKSHWVESLPKLFILYYILSFMTQKVQSESSAFESGCSQCSSLSRVISNTNYDSEGSTRTYLMPNPAWVSAPSFGHPERLWPCPWGVGVWRPICLCSLAAWTKELYILWNRKTTFDITQSQLAVPSTFCAVESNIFKTFT